MPKPHIFATLEPKPPEDSGPNPSELGFMFMSIEGLPWDSLMGSSNLYTIGSFISPSSQLLIGSLAVCLHRLAIDGPRLPHCSLGCELSDSRVDRHCDLGGVTCLDPGLGISTQTLG